MKKLFNLVSNIAVIVHVWILMAGVYFIKLFSNVREDELVLKN